MNIELTIDEVTGNPLIKIRHLDKSGELNEKLLNVFLKRGLSAGILLKRKGGYLKCGTNDSHEDYEIVIND